MASSQYSSCWVGNPFLKAEGATWSLQPTIVIPNTLHIRASSALYRIMALLKCLKWISRSKSPLNGVMDDVVNRFGGGACFTSSVKGE
ncbi:unnamed protein product [Prunus armeniaca]